MKIAQTLKRLVFGRGVPPAAKDEIEDLKLRYREFKSLLRANNEVLSLIAEIETQLTDGAAIGLDFLSSRYISASAKVYKMILHLNRIASNRYRGLLQAFDLIRSGIDEALTLGGGEKARELVLPLSEVERDLTFLAGAKAANLAHIKRLGLLVPEGFVITATAFRRVMEATGLSGQVRQAVMLLEDLSYQNLAQLSRQIEEKLMTTWLPGEVEAAIRLSCETIYESCGGRVPLSFRSSAVGEDSEASFAGQYRTVLNVPAEGILNAYRQVLASLYEPQAVVYRRRHGLRDEDAEMAVLVLTMLTPASAGVMYTRDPRSGESGPLLINAVHGLGQGLVSGAVTPDTYVVDRRNDPKVISSTFGHQATLVRPASGEGVEEVTAMTTEDRLALTREKAEELAGLGLILEEAFSQPQDVEWALMPDGRLFILQSRPLELLNAEVDQPEPGTEGLEVILTGGQTARPGQGSGPAYLIYQEADLAGFPAGGVLVARQSSPVFACIMEKAAAVVTELGGATGHMASLAREFGVPALVGAAGAMSEIRPGRMVTVDAGHRRVLAGKAISNGASANASHGRAKLSCVVPPWHQAARLITPLTLTDPRSDRFRPEGCRTFHDIIRFVHEKSFHEMFRLGDALGRAAANEARRLANKLPFELRLIDLGQGLIEEADREVSLDEVLSRPGRAFFEGLLDPNIHWDRPRPISMRGLGSVLASSLLTPTSDGQMRDMGETTFAILSGEYLNFNSRVGYHFAALDSVAGPNLNDNYISFRFQGGAAAADRRTLRAELISMIVGSLGFGVEQQGDQVHAFCKKSDESTTGELLRGLGRLIIYTRQMDMLCHDRGMVDWLVRAFLSGNYNLEPDQPEAKA